MSQRAAGEIFDRGMAQLCAVWGHEHTPDLLCAYWIVLGRYSAKQLEQAFTRALRSADRWPTPAQLVARIDPEPRHSAEKPIAEWSEGQRAEMRDMHARLRTKCAEMELDLRSQRERRQPPPPHWQDERG